jgi:hypothetical protein
MFVFHSVWVDIKIKVAIPTQKSYSSLKAENFLKYWKDRNSLVIEKKVCRLSNFGFFCLTMEKSKPLNPRYAGQNRTLAKYFFIMVILKSHAPLCLVVDQR